MFQRSGRFVKKEGHIMFDIIIIGGGPAGLTRGALRQAAEQIGACA